MISPQRFWLHVPLETTRGDWLTPPTGGRMKVLDRDARLLQRDLPKADSLTLTSTPVVRQWLLFDPLPEDDARSLFSCLRAKIPVLALRQNAAFRVSALPLYVAQFAMYNGPIPTLIPADFTPSPVWGDLAVTSYLDGRSVLEQALIECPSVTDDRLLAALDLAVASRYDVLPRSIFLAHLTIIDSLAVQIERPATIKTWLDTKISEAQALGDQGLLSSLSNLRQGSHGAAVRGLVARAAAAKGLEPEEAERLAKLVGKLYSVRSGLSHAGTSEGLDIEGAKQLVRLVLDAALANPAVLDPPSRVKVSS